MKIFWCGSFLAMVALLYNDRIDMAWTFAGFCILVRMLWAIEVKLNALLDDKGIQVTETEL